MSAIKDRWVNVTDFHQGGCFDQMQPNDFKKYYDDICLKVKWQKSAIKIQSTWKMYHAKNKLKLLKKIKEEMGSNTPYVEALIKTRNLIFKNKVSEAKVELDRTTLKIRSV